MNFNVIVTLGPAILKERILRDIDALGDCIYRINGAHVTEAQVSSMVREIRQTLPEARIVLDIPGSKMRTAGLSDPIRLTKGETFLLHDYQVNYAQFFSSLREGDTILANDSLYSMEVVKKEDTVITILSHSDGLLFSNKGLHVRGGTGKCRVTE